MFGGPSLVVAASVALIELHGPQGQRFFVNPAMITSIREPIGKDRQHFETGMRCVVMMTNGKFVPARETCDEVRDAINMERK